MPSAIIKTTQSGQVARALETHISSGHFRPGRKMPSIRKLANQYDVSEQVIKSALDGLAERNLIVREPRVGVFVNADMLSQHREYWLLSSRRIDNPDIPDYASQVLSVADDGVWKGINLSTRLLSTITPGIIQYELDKILAARPDCLLTQDYTTEVAALYADLPFPVVVIGDIEEMLPKGAMPANQIVENTGERAAYMVNAAADAGCRRFALIAGSDPTQSWGKLLREGGERAARDRGVDFSYVRHLSGRHGDTVRTAKQEAQADGVLIDGFRDIGGFTKSFREAGYRPGEDLKIFANGEMCPGTTFIKTDYRDFSRAILARVDSLIKDPASPLGRIELSGLITYSLISLV